MRLSIYVLWYHSISMMCLCYFLRLRPASSFVKKQEVVHQDWRSTKVGNRFVVADDGGADIQVSSTS